MIILYYNIVEVKKKMFLTEWIEKFRKKGVGLTELPGIVMILAIIAIAIAMVSTVLSDIQGTQTANSVAYNATQYGLTSMNNLGKWTPTIAIVIAAAVILGILLTAFAFRRNRL